MKTRPEDVELTKTAIECFRDLGKHLLDKGVPANVVVSALVYVVVHEIKKEMMDEAYKIYSDTFGGVSDS